MYWYTKSIGIGRCKIHRYWNWFFCLKFRIIDLNLCWWHFKAQFRSFFFIRRVELITNTWWIIFLRKENRLNNNWSFMQLYYQNQAIEKWRTYCCHWWWWLACHWQMSMFVNMHYNRLHNINTYTPRISICQRHGHQQRKPITRHFFKFWLKYTGKTSKHA